MYHWLHTISTHIPFKRVYTIFSKYSNNMGKTGNEWGNRKWVLFFIALYYKMTKGVFNERFLTSLESLTKAIKEEVDLVKENKKTNPKSEHNGSVIRAAIKFVHANVEEKSRRYAKKGRLGSTSCPGKCYIPLVDLGWRICSNCDP